jgi:hypothetical protein
MTQWAAMLMMAAWFGAGCTSVSLQSSKDASAVRKTDRLFIIINQDDVKKQQLAKSLAVSFQGCFTNGAPIVEMSVLSPLDLDESAVDRRVRDFHADTVLIVSLKTFIIDETGGYPNMVYDASLYEASTHKRIWRAAINNSGSTDLMDRRMREMAEKIVQQLRQDGFL